MNLLYPKNNLSFELKKNIVNNWVIEDSHLFERFVKDLYEDVHGLEDNFVLSHDYESLNISKSIAFVMSPLDFEYDKRDFSKKFISYFKRDIDENDFTQKIVEKYTELKDLIEDICLISDIPIEFNDMIDENDIIKHFDIHIKTPQGSFAENIIEYGSVLKRLTDKNVMIFANCEAYINDDEYEYIRKYIKSEEFYILFVSNRKIDSVVIENTCIIDIDMCEIY